MFKRKQKYIDKVENSKKQNKPKLTRTTTITAVKQKFETKIKQ